jgi:hypothetical protein
LLGRLGWVISLKEQSAAPAKRKRKRLAADKSAAVES